MRRAPVVVGAIAVLALSGCFAQCGPTVEGVAWTDPDFAAALSETPLDGWTVQRTDPTAGAPTANRTLLDWGASLVEVERRVPDDGSLRLHHRGTLTLTHREADAAAARDTVDAFLAEVTDGNATERDEWTDALLDARRPDDDPHAGEHGEGGRWTFETDLPRHRLRLDAALRIVPLDARRPDDDSHAREHGGDGGGGGRWTFETDLPRHRLRLDAALRIVPLDAPDTNPRAEGWSVRLAFPEVWAQRGPETFFARVDGNEYFGDWHDDATEGEARTRFQAAYRSLGVGEPPMDVTVVQVVC